MSEIECPYCGYSYEYDDVVESDEWFEECEQCRKEFKVQVEWDPTITAARLFEKAEKALLRDADAYFAQRAAQEALSLLKTNEQQIEQLHTLLEQEGSEDDR